MAYHQKRSSDFYSWFRRHYLSLIILLLALYLFFAFLAPLLMKGKVSRFGKMIYIIYSNFCHQFAHRSWFLFGEQAFYPTNSVDIRGIRSLGEVFGVSAESLNESRGIIGNESAGFKVAICQRDVAIYSAMLISAFIHKYSQRRIKKIPLWSWFLLAVAPIGIDGLWQFISSSNFPILWIFSYESTPVIRTITGGMFGFFTGWYLFPAIEDTFQDETYGRIKKIEI